MVRRPRPIADGPLLVTVKLTLISRPISARLVGSPSRLKFCKISSWSGDTELQSHTHHTKIDTRERCTECSILRVHVIQITEIYTTHNIHKTQQCSDPHPVTAGDTEARTGREKLYALFMGVRSSLDLHTPTSTLNNTG